MKIFIRIILALINTFPILWYFALIIIEEKSLNFPFSEIIWLFLSVLLMLNILNLLIVFKSKNWLNITLPSVVSHLTALLFLINSKSLIEINGYLSLYIGYQVFGIIIGLILCYFINLVISIFKRKRLLKELDLNS